MKNSLKALVLAGFLTISGGLKSQAQNTSTTLQQNISQEMVNRENKNSLNDDIKIKSSNAAKLSTTNGDIIVMGYNGTEGTISTTNGDVDVMGNNDGTVSTNNGDIDISGDNNNSITTNNGDIKAQNNKGKITTGNGNVTIKGHNYKSIKTNHGSVTIIGDNLDVSKTGSSIVQVNGNTIISTQTNGSNVVTINGNNVTVNGKAVTGNSGENTIEFSVNELTVYFKDKKILVDGKKYSLVSGGIHQGIKVLTVSDKIIILQFQNQKISLSLDGILVEKI